MKETGISGSETGGPPRTPNITGPKPTKLSSPGTSSSRSVVSTPLTGPGTPRAAIITPKTPISCLPKLSQLSKLKKPMTPLEDITKSSPIALLKPRNFPRRLNINVGTLTGRTFQLSVMSTDTIAEIKSRIQDEEGISAETQILVFREQELKDNAQLFSLGVQDGSTIQLVVHMTGGPGAPLKTRLPESDADNVVLLLCKQDSEYFVVDIRLKDDQEMTSLQRLQHIQESLRDGSLLELLGNVECVDIVDLSDLPPGLLEEQIESVSSPPSRPMSSGSVASTSSFISFISQQDGFDTPSGESIYQLLCDAEWMLNNEAQEMKASFERLQEPQSVRPATAISLMRLPNGSRPMLVIPKSRPASADTPMSKETKPVQMRTPKPVKSQKKAKSRESIKAKTPKKEPALLQFTSRPASNKALPKKQVKRTECLQCQKKLGPAQVFNCKCTGVFCAQHRYSDRHQCSHDYKQDHKQVLERENPVVKRDKIIRL